MKKYIHLITALSFVGAVIAALLTWMHFSLEYAALSLFCSGNATGNCVDMMNQSGYTTFLGMPNAIYGLFFYCLVLFVILIADYAGGPYYLYGFFVLFPLVILSLLADAVLASVMVRLKSYCMLCLFTYAINMALLIVFVRWKRQMGIDYWQTLKKLLAKRPELPEEKATAALFILFIFLLSFSIFSTSYILTIKAAPLQETKTRVKQGVEAFYKQTTENPVLPQSMLRIGKPEAKVQIVVFTDFLCSYCYKMYQVEKEVYDKYTDKVSFVFYNYPLDNSCNSQVKNTVYPSSCVASKAILSGASLNVFSEYLTKHFARYAEFHAGYDLSKAISIAADLTDQTRFEQEMNSAVAEQIIQRDIQLAENLRVTATPTLFINGRRYSGAPSRELLEAIIERELQ